MDEAHTVRKLDTGLWQCVRTLVRRAGSPLFLLALIATLMPESPADLEPFLVIATEGSVAWAANREDQDAARSRNQELLGILHDWN